MTNPILLSDQQVQEFICHGFLLLEPSVAPGLHEVIDQKLQWISKHEGNPGNNITARLPELQQIVESPEVRGALISLLGEDFFMIPHRFWHNRNPRKKETEEGLFSEEKFKEIVGESSHQDRFSPSSPGRSHSLQYLRIMYYSHELDLIHGPTHVVPGSQYNASTEDEDRLREIPVTGKAGTVFISHFDLIHAGSPNQSDRVRNMTKLLFARSKNPDVPNWSHNESIWVTPQNHLAPYKLENLWKKQWHWLLGQDSIEEKPELNKECAVEIEDELDDILKMVHEIQSLPVSSDKIGRLMGYLNTSHQALRSSAIYSLAKIGSSAIEPLLESILKSIAPDDKKDDLVGGGFSLDDESYALAACGEMSIAGLVQLLESGEPWPQINALHVISEVGKANARVLGGIEACLNSKSNQVVSFAALALGKVGSETHIPWLLRVLGREYDEDNHQGLLDKNKDNVWPVQYAIHFHAAFSLVRLSAYAESYEKEIASLLHHPFGQVSMLVGECLKRIGTTSALKTLVDFLEVRRWDDSLNVQRTF
jgi:hypothetical protein